MSMLLSKLLGSARNKWSAKSWVQKKTKERSRVVWSHRICKWRKSQGEWPCLFKRSCWAVHWKKPVKRGTKLSIYVTGSTECHVLHHADKIANCINYAANHLLDKCPLFLEKTLRDQIASMLRRNFTKLVCNQWNQDTMSRRVIKGCVAEVAKEITQLLYMDILPKIRSKEIAVLDKIEKRKLPIILLMTQLPQHKRSQIQKLLSCALFQLRSGIGRMSRGKFRVVQCW